MGNGMPNLLKIDHVLLSMLDTLAHCLRNFFGFAYTEAYLTDAVSDNNKNAEAESFTALDDLAYPVDRDYTL